MTVSRSVLRMRNFSDKHCSENQNTYFISNTFFSPENLTLYEITWKNMVEPGRPQMTIWRKRFARCITLATNAHSEWVIVIFSRQQWS